MRTCAPGGQNLGVAQHSGYAEYILVPDAKYLVNIDGLDPTWAATLACSGLTSYSSVDRVFPLNPDEPVLVCGAGGVGLTTIAVLKARGHEAIGAIDINENNLALAKEIGAEYAFNSTTQSAEDITQELGQPAAGFIDFVNNGETAGLGFQLLRKGGTMVQVGLFGGEFVVPTALLALEMIRIEGNFVGNLQQLKELVKIAQNGDLPSIPIQERALTAENVTGTLDDLAEGRSRGRVVLTA